MTLQEEPIMEQPRKSLDRKPVVHTPKTLPALSDRTKTGIEKKAGKNKTAAGTHESLLNLDTTREMVEKRFLDAILTKEVFKSIAKTPDSTQEVQSCKRFSDMTASDLQLLCKEGFPLAQCLTLRGGKNELKFYFGKNASLKNGGLPAELLIPDTVTMIQYQGESYTRKPGMPFTSKDGESLTIGETEVVTLLIQKSTNGNLSTEQQKQSQAYREQLLKDARFRDNSKDVLDAYASGKEPKLQPKTDNPSDAQAFMTFLLAFFGKIFGKDLTPDDVKDGLDPSKQSAATQKAMSERIDAYRKGSIPFDSIRSVGVKYIGKTPACSFTTQEDARSIFGITLPRGNPVDLQSAYKTGKNVASEGVPMETKGDTTTQILTKLDEQKGMNVVDLYTHSNKKHEGRYFGHRLLGFRNESDGQWYVLDAYLNQRLSSPRPMRDYLETVCVGYGRPMEQMVFYKSEKRVG